mgnify:CR=1 FL=1
MINLNSDDERSKGLIQIKKYNGSIKRLLLVFLVKSPSS